MKVHDTPNAGRAQLAVALFSPQDLGTLFSKPSPQMLAKVAKRPRIDRPVENLPLRELADFFSETCDFAIFIDDLAFRRATEAQRDVGDRPVNVPAQDSTVEKILGDVAKVVSGKLVVRDEMILIVPDLE